MKPISIRYFLSQGLSSNEMQKVRTSFDIIGDIAVIRVPITLNHRRHKIAQAVMKTNSSIKTVMNQTGAIRGSFRLRRLEYILGEKKTVTIYREHGCCFKVDLASVYFSPRLSFERMRIANLVNHGETIVNMFAGVGCYSIMIAKHRHVKRIFSIDLNPKAVKLMKDNVQLNHVADKITVIEGDARDIILKQLKQSCDRVLMPLPELAYEYLESAIQALKDGKGTIHYYDVIFAEKSVDPIEKLRYRIEPKLQELTSAFKICDSRVVRMVGPRWYQIVLDICITKV